ncbi:MAG TPA: ClpX C4-type zinc finger protein, partial [Kofleriaceae bacterium]|nr:ClpX C4-type zinc finger protein [Kofleriaceae bacterium]
MASCAFCGRDEKTVGKMFSGGGDRTGRAGMPAVHICGACAAQCAELIGEERPAPSAAEPEARVLVEWTPFVVDDRALEWAAARIDIEGSGAVLVSVRRPGRADSGVGVVFPETTPPTIERAFETARSFWR